MKLHVKTNLIQKIKFLLHVKRADDFIFSLSEKL
jgi:hypothetical protein